MTRTTRSYCTSAPTAPPSYSIRDKNSVIFGKSVKQFVSRSRASWTAGQTAIFRKWIEEKGQANFVTCDLSLLLKRLDLDGYGGITNVSGYDVQDVLLVKVTRKLKAENKKMKDENRDEENTDTESEIETPVKEEQELEAAIAAAAAAEMREKKNKKALRLKRAMSCLVRLKEASRDMQQVVEVLPDATWLDSASDDIVSEIVHLEKLMREYLEY